MERLVHTDTASLTDHVATNASDQLTAYLARLGWSSSSPSCALPPPTLDTLRGLHGLHVRHVTFENLDLHCGRHIYLDLPTLFAKIVERRRGGFCFELNGLYAHMLSLLGFERARDTLYAARVFVDGAWRDTMSHCVTVATLPSKQPHSAANENDEAESQEVWISDVGFGSSPQVPLRYDRLGEVQEGDAEWAAFRFSRIISDVTEDQGGEVILLERLSKSDGQWQKNLLIYPEPRQLAQLALQADETAHFNRRILVSVVTDTERKTLTGARRLCITRFADGTRDEKYIHEGVAPEDVQREKEIYVNVLAREFGLKLTPEEQETLDLETSKRNASLL